MKLYCYIHKPATVFAAQINQATFTFPLTSLTYDNVTSGAYGNVKPGMTMLLGSAPGLNDYGRQRIRSASATTVDFPKTSRGYKDGTLEPLDNKYLTVLNLYQVWAKIPYIADDGTMYKDGDITIGSGDYGTEIPPQANGGPGFAGFVDEDTGLLSVNFDASGSFAITGTISSKAWDFVDGTPSSSTSDTVTVDFPAGFRYVSLTVTSSDGKTHTQRIPVFAAEKTGTNAPIDKFRISSQTRSISGTKLTLKIDQNIDDITYPDGTLVMLWYDQDMGNPDSAPDRGTMAFIGWIQNESHKITKTKKGTIRTATLDCLDVSGKLATLPGFSQTLQRDTSPSKWTEMAGLNIDKYLHHLLYWHSTALDVADFYWSGLGSDYPIPILGSNGSSLYDQVDKRAQAIVHRLTCNRFGQLKIKPDPNLQNILDRTANVNMSLTQANWGEDGISLTKKRPPATHWGKESTIVAQATDADAITKIQTYFALAPGLIAGQGVSASTIGEQLVVDLNELLTRAGHRYARQNANYGMFDVNIVTLPETEIDPAEMEWVLLTMGGVNATYRNLNFIDRKFLCHEITYNYDHKKGTRTARASLEMEAIGTLAVDVTTEENETEIPYTNPYDILPLQLVDPTLPDVLTPARALIATGDGRLIRVTGVDEGGTPDFTQVIAPGTGDNTGSSIINDPYEPDTIFLLRKNGVWRARSVWDTPVVEQVWAPGTYDSIAISAGHASIINSINRQGYFGWGGVGPAPFYRYVYTTDNFQTFHVSNFTAEFHADSNYSIVPGLFNTSSNGAIFWIGGQTTSFAMVRSLNWGATFNHFVFAGQYCGPMNIYYKLPNGTDNTINDVVIAVHAGAFDDRLLVVHQNGSSSVLVSGLEFFDLQNEFSPYRFTISTDDGNNQAAAGRYNLHITYDNWATHISPSIPDSTGQGFAAVGCSGYPSNPDYYIAFGGGNIQITFDAGSNWVDLGSSYRTWANATFGGVPEVRYVWGDLSQWFSAPIWSM